MDFQNDKVIGIVGGMGPQAGVELFNRILSHTRAQTDQEHLSVMLMSFPKYLSDRSSFLDGTVSINPAYNIVKVIEKLENAGTKVVGIACNTSHVPEIFNVVVEELDKRNSQVRLGNMVEETCRYLKENYPGISRVGLMATNGTYKSGLYEKLLVSLGYEVVLPDAGFQHSTIHRMIYDPHFGIKANPHHVTDEAACLMDHSIQFFKTRKAEAVILGCTELPLILSDKMPGKDFVFIDSIEALAVGLIREAAAIEKPSVGVVAEEYHLS